jgi:hypothetical protein
VFSQPNAAVYEGKNQTLLTIPQHGAKYISSEKFGGVAKATPPNQPQRSALTDYFNNCNFSKLK